MVKRFWCKVMVATLLTGAGLPLGLVAQETMAWTTPQQNWQAAQSLYQAEQWQQSYAILRTLVQQLLPSNSPLPNQSVERLYHLLGLRLEPTKQWEKAQAWAKDHPLSYQDTAWWSAYADAAFFLGKWQQALEAYEWTKAAGADLSADPTRAFRLAYLYQQKGDLAQAKKAYHALAQSQQGPIAVMAQQQLGALLRQEKQLACEQVQAGRTNEALQTWEGVLAYDSLLSPQEQYCWAWTLQTAKSWDKAALQWQNLASKHADWEAIATYHLGQVRLALHEKRAARQSFLLASQSLKEVDLAAAALFQVIALGQELGLTEETLVHAQNFVLRYPQHPQQAAVQEMRIDALLRSQNPRAALAFYHQLGNAASPALKARYGEMLLQQAMQWADQREWNQALRYADSAAQWGTEKNTLSWARFWQTEWAYRQKNWPAVVAGANAFFQLGPPHAVPVYQVAYNQACAHLQMEQGAAALQALQKAEKALPAGATDLSAAIALRKADAYFLEKQFAAAQSGYEKVLGQDPAHADHALYQLAAIAGAQLRTSEKKKWLSRLVQQCPQSGLLATARMEWAMAEMNDEQPAAAAALFAAILADSAAKGQHPQALWQWGLAALNQGQSDQAMSLLQSLVERFPQSAAAQSAEADIRALYADKGKMADYLHWMATRGKANQLTVADSLQMFQEWSRQPKEKEDPTTALKNWKWLAQHSTSTSLRQEALRGQLRCQVALENWGAAAALAKDLKGQPQLSKDEKEMAFFALGRQAQLDSFWVTALDHYASAVAAGPSDWAAQALYRQAEIQLAQGQYAAAEKTCFQVFSQMGAYPQWVTRSYILVGDVYAAQSDWFNAAATYKSVWENADDPQWRKLAKEKWEAIANKKTAQPAQQPTAP